MIRAFDKWLLPYLRRERYVRPSGKTQVFLVICDHFEPKHAIDRPGALKRLDFWQATYPAIQREIFETTGLKIAHTFFYPIEQYDSEFVDRVAEICRACHCETEIHLHHRNDTAEHLRECLEEGKQRLEAHGLLSRSANGDLRYGFIHGNWALDDSDPHGRNCGVPNELGILRQTGCYADFTMPSAPDGTQTRTINSIYYARDTPEPKSHDRGCGASPDTTRLRNDPAHLLLIQGPLALNWQRRKWGILPTLENADLTGRNPPTAARFHLWGQQGIVVAGRPQWVFVKLHTHGALPENSSALLGDPMRCFCRDLHTLMADDPDLEIHFLTARQAVNLVHAAEDRREEDCGMLLDYIYRPVR